MKMGKVKFIFLGLCFFGGIFELAEGQSYPYYWHLTLNRPCTNDIFENDASSIQMKNLRDKLESGTKEVFKGNVGFATINVEDFSCQAGKIIVGIKVLSSYNDTKDIVQFNKVWSNQAGNVNSTIPIMKDIQKTNFGASTGKLRSTINLYAELDGSLRESYFCENVNNFKKKLSKTLILKDGISTADYSQIIIKKHPCGEKGEKALLKDVQFYVSKANSFGEVDVALTTLAFKIVEQMIYDGTEWRLGLVLYKYLDSIKLLGTLKPDFGLSDFEITYIGFGAVFGLIVLIILIVLMVRFARKCCCPNCCGGSRDKKDFVSVQMEPNNSTLFQTGNVPAEVSQVVNYDIQAQTNPAYEELPRYDDVVHPVVVTCEVRKEEEPEYFELKAVSSASTAAPVMNTFQEPDPIEVDEIEIEPVYDNPVESSRMEDDLLQEPDDIDTTSIDIDIVEGKELGVVDLASVLADEGALLNEFDQLSNRYPGAMLYPDDVAFKNRTPNSFPWPESRVPLGINNPSGDYINASFARNNNGALAYIATQGPMEHTTEDFWTMVIERNVSVIVMATPLNLRGLELCHQYWPRDQKLYTYGEVKVQLSRKELKPDFLVMRVSAYIGDAEPRSISIYRYMSWPSNDIPGNAKSIVAFLLEIREVCENLDELPVFHCSSGRGMSAVLIALWNGMLSIEERNVANVGKIVYSLRKDLPGAIESYEQYRFLYQVLLQYAQFNAI